MVKAHKIRLYPNNKQVTYFKMACGTCRFVYNWALGLYKSLLDDGEKPTVNYIDKVLNDVKKEGYFAWMYKVTKYATQLTIQEDLKNALNRFFKGTSKFPKFKKKGVNDSFRFYFDASCVKKITTTHVWIPVLGHVRLSQPLRFKGKLLYGTVSRRANKWFISISVEVPDSKVASRNDCSGLTI